MEWQGLGKPPVWWVFFPFLKACSTRNPEEDDRLWLYIRIFFPNGTARRTSRQRSTVSCIISDFRLSMVLFGGPFEARDLVLKAPTPAGWLMVMLVTDFHRLSGGSTDFQFFRAFKAWWKIHSSPLVAVCFPSSENAGVFGGAVGSRVSSCTARSPVGASTKKTYKHHPLQLQKWLEGPSFDIGQKITWRLHADMNFCQLLSFVLRNPGFSEPTGKLWCTGQGHLFCFIDLPKDRKDRKDRRLVELMTLF